MYKKFVNVYDLRYVNTQYGK